VTIPEFIDELDSREKTLIVQNRDEPSPLVKMLKDMVEAPDVTVREAEPHEEAPANIVLLQDESSPDGTLAVSTIADIGDSVLMVNGDLYITGTRSIEEVETPDVLAGLDETTFSVAGKQKMLLVEISRHVESLAWRTPASTLHSGFQYLSRLDDERGTSEVYERLAEHGTEIHVYGVPDEFPTLPASVTVHGNEIEELRRSWFVVNTDCPSDRKAALVAYETAANEWDGAWTFDDRMVDRIADYLTETYPA
jgi:hypothetical protein